MLKQAFLSVLNAQSSDHRIMLWHNQTQINYTARGRSRKYSKMVFFVLQNHNTRIILFSSRKILLKKLYGSPHFNWFCRVSTCGTHTHTHTRHSALWYRENRESNDVSQRQNNSLAAAKGILRVPIYL